MDDTATTQPSYMELPKESRLSYVLNGVGNGVMIGGVVALIHNVLKGGTAQKISGPGTTFAVVAGTLIGGAYGFHESNRIHDYRAAVSGEINKLRHEVDGLKRLHTDKAKQHHPYEPKHSR